MKRYILYLIIIATILPTTLKGQVASNNTQIELEKLFRRLVENNDDTARLRINDSIRIIVDGYVRSDSIFNHRFTNLKYLGQITSPDSILKIVTWNLVLKSSPGRYFCFFVKKGDPNKENRIYSLTTSYREEQIRTDTTYTAAGWYGALYYDLKPYVINEKRCWILLGIDYGDPLVSRKIIEVLSFTSDDSILFGRKWFESGDQFRYRQVFEYSSNGMMTLRFASDRSVVFDHLVPIYTSQNAGRQSYGSDYSYDAYNFENGIWRLSINVDARNKE